MKPVLTIQNLHFVHFYFKILLTLFCLLLEFASQLPHDGGAFYTNDTMESSRPYYATSWPPILHAAALYLNAEDFSSSQTESEVINVNCVNNNPSNNASDQFHLLFGICMEALCSPRSTEPLESIITCLKALYTLLDSNVAKEFIMVDKTLGIELCNVLHRLILTRDSHMSQLLCMEVLKQVISAAQQHLEKCRKDSGASANQEESVDLDLLGEGGDSGEILPGKSLVFAVLEICLCLLVRQLPALSPAPNSTIITSMRMVQNWNESSQLVAAAISSMENLHKLCSPRGAESILPTILYLTTGVIKEMATKSSGNTGTVAHNPAVQAALHCLKTLTTDKYSKDERCESWQKLLQSALAKVIDLAKTGDDDNRLDEVTMMLAIAVFVLHAPAKVVTAPNLQYPCINHFKQCLQSSNPSVRILFPW